MVTLSLIPWNCGRSRGREEFASLSYNYGFTKLRTSLNDLKGSRVRNRTQFRVVARIRKGKKNIYPWPNDFNPDTETPLAYLSYFKPLDEKPKPVTLAFEKPLVDLERKIIEVREMADDTGLDFSSQISALESKYQQALKDLYTHLTPFQRLNIARHPNRPTVLDHVMNITEKWVELHGDRAGYDDPAIVTGLGTIEGRSYLFIGHQKGRNTKENIMRNFAMPTPHGYRKALRMMKYADHHGFPIITFVDTPGAFADLKSEELGQGEAIAHNLRTMFGLKVPIITIVTGEGGSGGALAIACANKLFMLENSAFFVASPEACAAILWKSSKAAPKAAEKLRITAQEHYKLGITDGIIPEPLGGAHADPAWSSQQIKHAIIQAMEELTKMDKEELLRHRALKFRAMGVKGGFKEGTPVEPERKRNMKPSEVNMTKADDIELEIANLKKKILEAKGPSDPITHASIKKLEDDLDKEMKKAFNAMGLLNKIESLKLDISRASNPNQPVLQEKAKKIMQEFKQNLSRPGAYLGLKQKLQTLSTVKRFTELKEKNDRLKTEVNRKISGDVTKALEKLLKKDLLDENLTEEVERMKKDLGEVLKSANLEITGMRKRKKVFTPPELEEKMVKMSKEMSEEIEKAIEKEGLRDKIEELKGEVSKDPSSDKVKELEAEIKEGIAAALSGSTPLKKKVESLREEVASFNEATKSGFDNGKL